MSNYKKEWYEKNKEKCKEKSKKYRENNKEQVAQAKKEWYEKRKKDWETNGRPTLIYMFKLNEDNIYVGSTYDFNKRIFAHKQDLINKPDRLLYKTMIDLNIDTFEPIELLNCRTFSRKEKLKLEEEYRIKMKANLNDIKCYLSEEERKEQNINYMKQDRINNPEKYKERKKKYYYSNQQKCVDYSHNYYINNKNKIKEKVLCECGVEICKNGLNAHLKTKKHLKNI